MKIESVKMNGMERPMGYAFSNVTVSWRVENAVSQKQKESCVRIALDEKMRQIVSQRKGVLKPSGIAMDVTLQPRTTYYVTVSVTGTEGDSAEACACFDTGKMGEPWTAQWIGMPESCGFHPVLSKTFAAEKDVSRARLNIKGVFL